MCSERLFGNPKLTHISLWHDRNSNGVSELGEVCSLGTPGIVALSLEYVRMTDAERTPNAPRGVTFRDGTSRPTWDAVLQPAK